MNNKLNKNSLLDDLINKSKQKLESSPISKKTNDKIKNNINAEIFISSQKNNKNIISKGKINESKEVLVQNNDLKFKDKVSKSAKILDLVPEEIEISSKNSEKIDDSNDKKILNKVTQQNNFLNKAFLNKGLQNTVQNKKNEEIIKEKIVQDVQIKEEIKNITKEINIDAQNIVNYNITNKIISARQKINSFMSNMAKQMYQNYKPPVSAFRIKLNPANLGSIAIVLKSNKSDNSVNVSMNISSHSTYEVMQEEKYTLRDNLIKTFEDVKEFSMEFSMDNNDEDNFNEEQKNTKQKSKNQDIQESKNQSLESSQNYM